MSGTLRERPAGSGRWELRVYTGRDPVTGSPKQLTRTFHGGKRAAEKALTQLAAEVHAGQHVGTEATFGKLLDAWLANLVRSKAKAQSTLESYRIHVEKHIRPELGAVRLDKLTTWRLDEYFEHLEAKGLAPATIRLDHSVISAALTQGVDYGWLKANPARKVTLPAVQADDRPALTVGSLRTLYLSAVDDDFDMATAIALAALTGCRRGELCGLKWSDVDRDRATLKVERAWVPGKGGQHLTTTKTGKARTVALGSEGMAILGRYWDAQVERWSRDPDGWLLSYDAGTTPLRAKSLSEYVTALGRRQRPAIPVHFHQFRSFAATELVHQGVDLPTAAGQLGHSAEVMAKSYLKTSDDRRDAAADLIGAVVAKALLPADSADARNGCQLLGSRQ
jgi:integrase